MEYFMVFGWWDRIKEEMRRMSAVSQKDNVLAMVIHGIMTHELGWIPKKVHFGDDVHELEYYKPGSPLKELEIKLVRRGRELLMEFEGEVRLNPMGEFMDELMEQLFGIDLDDIKKKMVLELDYYVDDNLTPRNVDELVWLLRRVVRALEEYAARRAHY